MGIPLPALLLVASLAGAVAAWFHGRAAGVDACEIEHAAAAAEAQQANYQRYLAAVEWGNRVSAQLAQAQRRSQNLKESHETVARNLDGTCPVGLRVLHDAAALGTDVPDAARASLSSPATVAADWVGATVAENYARARECQAQLNALIAWHEGPQ